MNQKSDAVIAAAMLLRRLEGCQLVKLKRFEFEWVFEFGPLKVLQVRCPWRILLNGRIAFADSDDGRQFGLPEPVKGEDAVMRIAKDETIRTVTIREDTGDLSVFLGPNVVLEVMNMSSGYEGWEIGADDMRVIGLGGGELAVFVNDETRK